MENDCLPVHPGLVNDLLYTIFILFILDKGPARGNYRAVRTEREM